MERIVHAFRAFFLILFTGQLPADIAAAYGYARKPTEPPPPPPKPVPQFKPADGALQMLSILQRDSRLVDFLMEDISAYGDDQVGAAVRSLHDQCREALDRYVRLTPVIDGVEGTYTNAANVDASGVKFVGNVPASGKAPGGILRHRGWRADRVELPQLASSQTTSVIAPAEIEVE